MPKKKNSYELTLSPQEEGGNGEWSSGTLAIRVRELAEDRTLAVVSMTFDVKGDTPLGVYGFEVSIHASHTDSFERSIRMGRRLIKSVENFYTENYLENIMALLQKIAVEVVYDSREGSLIPISDIKSPDHRKYHDDRKELETQWARFSSIACSPLDAGLDILKQAASSNQTEWASNFLAHKMPVLQCQYTPAPDTKPAIERMKEAGLINEELT